MSCKLLPDFGLEQLAGGSMRKGIHEDNIVRNPPLCHLVAEETDYILFAALYTRLAHYQQQRPLIPFGMCDADHTGLGHRLVTHRMILQLDGTDPFAARLD